MSVCRKSAALILIREDFKVLLLKRNSDISFGGSYAFPGGAIDEADYIIAKKDQSIIDQYHSQYYCQKTQDWYKASLVAAIRETYEETNIQLNYQTTYSEMKPFIRIITPQFMKKRYDTQFLLLNLNHYEQLNINKDESSTYEWDTPTSFLDKFINKKIILFPPIFLQLFILKQLQTPSNIQKYLISGNLLKHTFPHIFQFTKGSIRSYPDPEYNVSKLIESEQTDYLKEELKHKLAFQNKTDFRFELTENIENFKGVIGAFRDSPLALLDGDQVVNKQFVTNKANL